MENCIQNELNKVLKLNNEKKRALIVVERTNTRKVGLHQIPVSPGQKADRAKKVRNLYDSKISTIYKDLNLLLEEAGCEKLENPFERKNENEN